MADTARANHVANEMDPDVLDKPKLARSAAAQQGAGVITSVDEFQPTDASNPALSENTGSAILSDSPATSVTSSTLTADTSASNIPGVDEGTSTPVAQSTAMKAGGLGSGAKIGLGVGIPILLILIGVAVFFFVRRKKQRGIRGEKGEHGEMIIEGKPGHTDEDGSSGGGPSGSPGYVHPGPPPQGSDGHMYAPPAMQDPSYVPQIAAGVAPIAGQGTRRSPADDEDLMARPVSPVHDDDLLTGDADGSVHTGRAGGAIGGSDRDRGSPTLDDDGEMQWILEEERKAKERREQQGRLPTVMGPSK